MRDVDDEFIINEVIKKDKLVFERFNKGSFDDIEYNKFYLLINNA